MRYKVVVAYQGSSYQGWQTQHQNNSVQEEIEAVLTTIHKCKIEIVASGRTDTKVHAKGQVFHFDSILDISEQGIKNALNALLSKQIRIQSVQRVSDDFHARFQVASKRYDYFVTSDVDNPFVVDFMCRESYELDVELMKESAALLLGTHDFTSFTSSRIDDRKSRVKTITRLDLSRHNDVVHMVFEGSGFLRYMVRMIAQTLIEVGKHKLIKQDVKNMLEAKSKHACKYKAEPNGLYLVSVTYS